MLPNDSPVNRILRDPLRIPLNSEKDQYLRYSQTALLMHRRNEKFRNLKNRRLKKIFFRYDRRSHTETECFTDPMDRSNSNQTGSSSRPSSKSSKKKNRKRYTITKPRESWTPEEHQLFVEALDLYERDWKRIESYIKTKSVIQIRSHAQKFFLKMSKSGHVDKIPPPRPKRKSTSSSRPSKRPQTESDPSSAFHPQNSASTLQHHELPSMQYQSQPRSHLYSDFSQMPIPMNNNPLMNQPHWNAWERPLMDVSQDSLDQAQIYLQQAMDASSMDEQMAHLQMNRQVPDFQSIYSFLGSLFDPSASGHVDELRGMSDIDRQVVQLLMQNLASNLGKPQMSSDQSMKTFGNPLYHVDRSYPVELGIPRHMNGSGIKEQVLNEYDQCHLNMGNNREEGRSQNIEEAADLLARMGYSTSK